MNERLTIFRAYATRFFSAIFPAVFVFAHFRSHFSFQLAEGLRLSKSWTQDFAKILLLALLTCLFSLLVSFSVRNLIRIERAKTRTVVPLVVLDDFSERLCSRTFSLFNRSYAHYSCSVERALGRQKAITTYVHTVFAERALAQVVS